MKKIFSLLLLAATLAQAGLPPTTSKVSGDSVNLTSFNYQFPNFTATRTGTTISLGVNSILGGGTGQTTANAALNAFLPSQTGNNGKFLQTDGSNSSWATASGGSGVTSVSLTAPSFLSVSGSPVTTTGTLALSLSGTALPVTSGGSGDTSFTANQIVLGGTTSTAALQQVAGATSGYVLTSQGTTSAPTFVAPSTVATVVATYYLSTNNTPGAATPINFDTRLIDNTNAVTTGASWKFTAPVTGNYSVTGYIVNNGSSVGNLAIYKNGSVGAGYFTHMESATGAGTGATIIALTAGDYIDIRSPAANVTYIGDPQNGTQQSYISIALQSANTNGAAPVALIVHGVYTGGTTNNPFIFPTVDYDSNSGYNASTGRYTAPTAGVYHVHGFINGAFTNTAIAVWVDGVRTPATAGSAGSTNSTSLGSFTQLVKVNSGQIIDVRPDGTQTGGGGSNLNIELIAGGGSNVSSLGSGNSRVVAFKFGGATEGTNNCTADPCTITRQQGPGSVSAVNRTAGGVYVVHFTAGTFSGPMTCTATGVQFGVGSCSCYNNSNIALPTATTYGLNCGADCEVSVTCLGPN